MGHRALAPLALILLAAAAQALTRPPVIHVLDYAREHYDTPEARAAVAAAPPDLLLVGRDVPMSHLWGPTATMGGENQAYGKGADIRRLTPDEVAARIELLRARNAALHQVGVTTILPYVCLMTLAGRDDQRTGFWEFYDHWADYATAFGLGPKPADPVTWLQQAPDGKPRRFYAYEGDGYPAYGTNQRYAVSALDPGWRQWMSDVVRLVARSGYDGVFVDNGGSFQSWDPRTQDEFRRWMAARWTPERLRELFGVTQAADLRLPAKPEGLLGAEAQRFWLAVVRDFLAMLREAGEQVNPGRPFRIYPNGAHQFTTIKLAHADCDWSMFELSEGPHGTTNTGQLDEPVVEDVGFRVTIRHLFEYLYPQAVGGRVRALLLTRPGYPRRNPAWEMNPAAAELGMAEAAAFGGGGGYLLRPSYDLFGSAMAKYRRFFAAHPALYDGLEPAGTVGVLAFADDVLLGNKRHRAAAERAVDAVGALHHAPLPVIETGCTTQGLAGFSAVVVPELRHLTVAQAGALAEFAARGKPVVIVGAPPARDELDRENAEVQALTKQPGVSCLPDATRLQLGAGLLDETAATHAVRVMVYRDPARPRWVVHLVNYRVALGQGVDRVVPVEAARLRLPAEWRASKVSSWDPDRAEPQVLPISGAGMVDVAPFRTYQVLELAR